MATSLGKTEKEMRASEEGVRYELKSQISERLYYAIDTKHKTTTSPGKRVVIDRMAMEELIKKWPESREESHVKKLCDIKCKNLVEILNHFYTGSDQDRVLWTVMERIKNPDPEIENPEYLYNFKKQYKDGDVKFAEIIALFIGICDGVEAMHKADVLHRDLKPANVYCIKENDMWVPKIGDYHSACGMGSKTRLAHMTIDYSPPIIEDEALEKLPEDLQKLAKKMVDIFPIGVMLWETLDEASLKTACKDRKNLSDNKKITQILSDLELEKPIIASSKYLTTIIHKALQIEPANVYQSASEMKADLEVAKRSDELDKVLALYRDFNTAVKEKIVKGEVFDLGKLQQAHDEKDALYKNLNESERKSHLWGAFEQMILNDALAGVWSGVRKYAQDRGFEKPKTDVPDIVQHYKNCRQKMFSSITDQKQKDKITAFADKVVQLCDICGDSPNY